MLQKCYVWISVLYNIYLCPKVQTREAGVPAVYPDRFHYSSSSPAVMEKQKGLLWGGKGLNGGMGDD